MDIVRIYKDGVSKLTNEEAAYILALVSLFIVPFVNNIVSFPSYWVSLGFVVAGAIIWLNSLAIQARTMLIVKAFWGVVIVGGTAFNLGLASTTVNSVLGVPSSAFAYTVTITSVLLIPITLSIVGFFLALPLMPIAILSTLTQIDDFMPKKLLTLGFFTSFGKHSPILFLGRIFACICLFSMSVAFNQDSSWYSEAVGDKLKWFSYHLEMEEFSYCKLASSERIAYLGNDRVVIASLSEGTYTFKVSLCEPEL